MRWAGLHRHVFQDALPEGHGACLRQGKPSDASEHGSCMRSRTNTRVSIHPTVLHRLPFAHSYGNIAKKPTRFEGTVAESHNPKQKPQEDFKVTRKLASGAFGEVSKGELADAATGRSTQVILKKAKEFGEAEVWMNERCVLFFHLCLLDAFEARSRLILYEMLKLASNCLYGMLLCCVASFCYFMNSQALILTKQP